MVMTLYQPFLYARLYVFFHFVIMYILRCRYYYYPHFTVEETEGQRS